MGNVQSEAETPVLKQCPHSSAHVPKSVNSNVTRKDFVSKFDHRLTNLAERLWVASFTSDVIPICDYESLLHKLSDTSDKLTFFLTLAVETEPNEKALRDLFCWFKFGQKFSDDFERALFRSMMVSMSDANSIDQLVSRLRLPYQDAADDLAKLVIHTLTSGTPVQVDFTVNSEFTTLLTPGLLWLFSLILSSPYKKPSSTRLRNSAPLEIEQLQHLHQLYDSTTHGFSFTRIKELAFDYDGPLLLLMKTDNYFFCLASDQGLRDSMKPYGDADSKLFKITPEFAKLVSGRSSKLSGPHSETGIIYSNFTAKTSRRGLLIGHQPLASPVLEINDGFTDLRFTGSPPMKMTNIEIWAAGSSEKLTQLRARKAWELSQVNKEKNRKFKPDEDWRESADRYLLTIAGVNVNHSAQLEAPEQSLANDNTN